MQNKRKAFEVQPVRICGKIAAEKVSIQDTNGHEELRPRYGFALCKTREQTKRKDQEGKKDE